MCLLYSVRLMKIFLPDVDLDHGNLNYTVVVGEVIGNFEAQKNAE